MQIQKRTVPIKFEKSASSDFDAQFTLSASTPDRVGDTISPSAYPKAIKGVDKLIALFNHNPNQIVGFWSDLKAKKDSLTGYIKFFHKDWGAMVKEMLEFGIPLGASIGFQGTGEYLDNGAIAFKEIELLETSIVAVPAHPRAQQIAKSYGIDLQSLEINEADLSAVSSVERDSERIISQAKAAILKANKTLRAKS